MEAVSDLRLISRGPLRGLKGFFGGVEPAGAEVSACRMIGWIADRIATRRVVLDVYAGSTSFPCMHTANTATGDHCLTCLEFVEGSAIILRRFPVQALSVDPSKVFRLDMSFEYLRHGMTRDDSCTSYATRPLHTSAM